MNTRIILALSLGNNMTNTLKCRMLHTSAQFILKLWSRPKELFLSSSWSNYFWPMDHFTKTWQFVGHFHQIDVRNNRFTRFKTKRESEWVHHQNYYTITIYYRSLSVVCLWSKIFWHYRSFFDISVIKSEISAKMSFTSFSFNLWLLFSF